MHSVTEWPCLHVFCCALFSEAYSDTVDSHEPATAADLQSAMPPPAEHVLYHYFALL